MINLHHVGATFVISEEHHTIPEVCDLIEKAVEQSKETRRPERTWFYLDDGSIYNMFVTEQTTYGLHTHARVEQVEGGEVEAES